ncbi:hypothetical protein QVD17_37676 [Tagetes erecta]|uniref:Uncharacterized protein n=1 Tax=Tagetes erecta TaxID=13708 RepID=A0AAD8JYQ6_TARER|nr:hypothetical protein QVD17_37676 [Tagetes erecta]
MYCLLLTRFYVTNVKKRKVTVILIPSLHDLLSSSPIALTGMIFPTILLDYTTIAKKSQGCIEFGKHVLIVAMSLKIHGRFSSNPNQIKVIRMPI